jgi:hypothetical protein
MFMMFHARPGHKVWLTAVFFLLLLAGGLMLSLT